MHDTLRIISSEPAPIVQAEMQSSLPECMTPTGEDHSIWLARQICPTTGLTLFPLHTLLPPHDMVTTIKPMQEGICSPVPTMERGVVVRVEVIRR